MGACLSKKKGSSPSPLAATKSASSTPHAVPELKINNPSVSAVTVSKPKFETAPEAKLKKDNSTKLEEKHETVPEPEGHVKKEIFIIKHRKSHDDRERNSNSKSPPCTTLQNQNATTESMDDKTAPPPAATNIGVVAVRTSSCTKEEVDAILIQCGRLSRSSSGNAIAAASSSGEHRRRYSGSKRSYDFDHCDNDTVSNDDDSKKTNANESNSDLCEDERHQHRPRHRQSPNRRPSSSQERRRRTPSREREQQQQQRSSSRERRVSRSPGRRSSENTTPASVRNNTSSRPGKMVSVPATVSSLVMDKSNNNGGSGGGGGGDSAATTGVKRIAVKRNVGAASPRSQSPARANGNKALNENQQQPSLSRSSSRKAEQSPYKRNPLSEIEPNSLAFPHSAANNSSSRVQNRSKKEFETEANPQKTNGNRAALDKGMSVNCKAKVQQEEDVKVQSSIADNIVVKTMVPPGVDTLKPYTLTRSRSSRRGSRDLDLNPEVLLNPPQSYASLLLEDIQNFHQKSTTPVSLPACVTKACSILEAVADLNSNTSLNFCGAEDMRSPPAFQCSRNDYGKTEPDAEDPVVESMLVFNDDDVMEPSLHKYVTVNRGGSVSGVVMDDQESSGSNSFTVSSGQQHWGVSSSSWEPSSVESKDCWTSRSNYSKEEGQKSPLGLEGRVASEAGCDAGGAKKKLNSQRRECDHQHGSGIGRGKLGAIPVITAAAST